MRQKIANGCVLFVVMGIVCTGLFLAIQADSPRSAFAQSSPSPLVTSSAMQVAAVATANGATLDTSKAVVATLQIVIVTTATVSPEATNDGTNWGALTCYPLGSTSGATSFTSTAIVRCNTSAIQKIRARLSAWTSGAVTVYGTASSNSAKWGGMSNVN